MPRNLTPAFAAALLSASLVAAACGGGSKPPAQASAAPSVSPTATSEVNKQPTVEDKVMPTPTKLATDAIALTVVNGKTTYSPKLDEAKSLQQTTITAEGKSYTGVSVATLAAKVAAKADSIFTIQGIRSDGKRLGFIRGAVSDMGATTVFVPLEDGHFNIVTSALPSDQWINFATAISFQ